MKVVHDHVEASDMLRSARRKQKEDAVPLRMRRPRRQPPPCVCSGVVRCSAGSVGRCASVMQLCCVRLQLYFDAMLSTFKKLDGRATSWQWRCTTDGPRLDLKPDPVTAHSRVWSGI